MIKQPAFQRLYRPGNAHIERGRAQDIDLGSPAQSVLFFRFAHKPLSYRLQGITHAARVVAHTVRVKSETGNMQFLFEQECDRLVISTDHVGHRRANDRGKLRMILTRHIEHVFDQFLILA